MTVSKKFALYPGYAQDAKTGKTVFFSHKKLAMLYGVTLAECVIIDAKHMTHGEVREAEQFAQTYNLPTLRPRADGNYQLPEKAQA